MKNIDLFNLFTGQILGSLYESFPVPQSLNPRSLSLRVLGTDRSFQSNIELLTGTEVDIERADPDTIPMSTTGIYERYTGIAHNTISWLLDCDYIRIAGNRATTLPEISRSSFVLSPKALEVLSMVPESLQQKQSYGSTLAETSKDLASEAGKSAISDIVGKVITAAISLATS